MKGIRTASALLAAALGAAAPAAQQGNAWRPAHTVLGPVCQATDWDQAGNLNAYVGVKEFVWRGRRYEGIAGAVCGCDPLAWGQIATYHALNHGTPSAAWDPGEEAGYVLYNGETVARQTLPGAFDWEAVRDKTRLTLADGSQDIPVARLMWNLGIVGHGEYGADAGTAATVGVESFRDYFGFGDGLFYQKPQANGEVLPYWREALWRILRCSLQAEAPLGVGIYVAGGAGHMAVIDGWGVDAEGKAWFHVDKGWGSANPANAWWDLDEAWGEIRHLYANVFPEDLGSLVVGRVTDAAFAPLAGASVVLADAAGAAIREATTDEAGCYVFRNLPRVDASAYVDPGQAVPTAAYTVTVSAPGFVGASRTVAVEAFVDETARQEKHEAWEDKGKPSEGGAAQALFREAYGGAVADFALEGVALRAAPSGSGAQDGSSWADAAPFSQALLDSAGAARAVWLAQGDYPLDAPLRVPAGAALLGGFDPETGRRAPLDAPSTLTLRATYQNAMVVFGDGATLDGLRLEDPDGGAGVMLQPEEDAKGASATLRACVLSGGRNNNLAQDVDFVCCVFMNAGAIAAPGGTALHCAFAGTLGDGADAGGNRMGLGAAALGRPEGALPCPAEGHVCPGTGLDGRPLEGTLGALAPAAPGWRLLIR